MKNIRKHSEPLISPLVLGLLAVGSATPFVHLSYWLLAVEEATQI